MRVRVYPACFPTGSNILRCQAVARLRLFCGLVAPSGVGLSTPGPKPPGSTDEQFHPFAGAAHCGMNDFSEDLALFPQNPDLATQAMNLSVLLRRQPIGPLPAIQLVLLHPRVERLLRDSKIFCDPGTRLTRLPNQPNGFLTELPRIWRARLWHCGLPSGAQASLTIRCPPNRGKSISLRQTWWSL